MKIVTAAEMRDIDRRTTEEFGIPSLTLMENAGSAVAEFCLREYPEAKTIGVICGKGNNGGDGFVAARKLHESGKHVRVLLLADPADVRGDAAEMLKRLPVEPVIARNEDELRSDAAQQVFASDLLVDAILGTGFKPPVGGLYHEAIEVLNNVGGGVVSIDIPSGVDADRLDLHAEFGVSAVPDVVVTFTAPKPFLAVAPMTVAVAQIGSPGELISQVAKSTKLNVSFPAHIDRSHRWFVRTNGSVMLFGRRADAHKGDFGHVLVIAGSRGKTGAAAMAGIAALRAGAGLCTVATAASVQHTVAGFAAELMTEPLNETTDGTISTRAYECDRMRNLLRGKTVLAVGPGVSRHPETAEFVRRIVKSATIPIVLDADGLNAFEGRADLLDGSRRTLVLTPHPGEMARLVGRSAEDVEMDRIQIARDFAGQHHCVVVLKGHRTVIAEPGGEAWINPTGNAGMAKGGSGDVLTGMIAAALAQINVAGPEDVDGDEEARGRVASVRDRLRLVAIITAVYLHGLAGDIAARALGMRAMLASDLIEHIGPAMRELNAAREDRFAWIGRLDRTTPTIE